MGLPLLVNIGFQVLFHSPPGVLFTFPSQYYALSVTKEYLALGGGPPCFPQDSSCPVVLRILPASLRFRLQDFHLLRCAFPKHFGYLQNYLPQSSTPICSQTGLGSFRFARRYSGNRFFFLLLQVLRCFSSLRSPCIAMDSLYSDLGLPSRVPPFGYLWIFGCLRLPKAFRSLPRPSSPSGA